jgi:hypothetical protein
MIDELRREHVQTQEEVRIVEQELAQIAKQLTDDERFIEEGERTLNIKEGSGMGRYKQIQGMTLHNVSFKFDQRRDQRNLSCFNGSMGGVVCRWK